VRRNGHRASVSVPREKEGSHRAARRQHGRHARPAGRLV